MSMGFIVAFGQTPKMLGVCTICLFDICQNIRHFVLDAVYKNIFKKYLTIFDKGGKISTLSTIFLCQKTFWKNQKTFAKGIDKREEMWYNSQAVREEAGCGTVIENWTTREKYKALRSAKILDLVKELYILKQSKRS